MLMGDVELRAALVTCNECWCGAELVEAAELFAIGNPLGAIIMDPPLLFAIWSALCFVMDADPGFGHACKPPSSCWPPPLLANPLPLAPPP